MKLEYVITETQQTIDLETILADFKSKNSDAMYYMENVLQYNIGFLEPSTKIEDFDFLRLFASNEEWKIKKYPTYYRLVKLNKEMIPKEKKRSKTLLIDDTARENKQLPFTYLEIEIIEDGKLYYESWKGVK